MKKYVILGIILLSNFCFIGKIDAKDFVVPSADYSLSDQEVTGFPYSSIVYIAKKYPNNNSSRGSGVVIGRDYVLTAGHVNNGWETVDIIPGLKSNNTDPFGRWTGDREKSKTSPYYVGRQAANDYAVIKVNPRKNNDGSYTHIGDVVKPLTLLPDAANHSFFIGDNLALVGYPGFNGHTQYFANYNVTKIYGDYRIKGTLRSSGGMSGGPLLNNAAQVIGPYHGSGSVSAMGHPKVDEFVLPWGLNQETSRVYVCPDKSDWEMKRKQINPEGSYVEKKNGDTISSAELKKASDVKPGYRLTKLTDGVNTYDVNNSFMMLIGGLTLYPKEAIANRYQIKFDENGGRGTMDKQAMTYNQKATVLKNKFEKVGYQFKEWNTQKDGQGKGYLADEEIQNLSTEQSGTAILYAQWQANQESATVSYIDNTINRILSMAQLSGLYETRDDYNTASAIADYLNQGYLLVSDAFPSSGLAYDKPGVVQTFEVHLKHQISEKIDTKQVSRTIRYIYADGTKAADAITTGINFNRTATRDEVTGEMKYSAWQSRDGITKFEAITSPTIAGYTADDLKIDTEDNINGDTKDKSYTVTYGVNTEQVKVNYIDDTTGKTIFIKKLSGFYGSRDSYQTADKLSYYAKKGYLLVSDAFPSNGLVYDKPGVVQTFDVHLKHDISEKVDTKQVSRTIRYTYADGTKAADAITTGINFTRTATRDEVTGEMKYSAWQSQDGITKFDAITSPTIAGYTADNLKIDSDNGITSDTKDKSYTVTYDANTEQAKVNYIDDTTGKTIFTKKLSGFYGSRNSYQTADKLSYYTKKGYLKVSDAFPLDGLVYDSPGVVQTFEVHLEHDISEKNDTKQVSRTIRYTYEDGTKAADDVTTVINFTRKVTRDEVTGDTKYGAWTSQDDSTKFDSITSPTISGTTADYLKIDAVNDITGDTQDMTSQVIYRKDTSSNGAGENKEKNSPPNEKKSGTVSAKVASPKTESPKTKTLKAVLPKTGESSNFKQIIIGFLLTGLIIIGLISYKKLRKAS
ncbi:mucin-binding protein [Lactococcus carnosus]|uniref:mucin-binding protein n=1 Tax=Pseudolactococcus carnosus TaxID=2749961 RepID=UPI001FB92EA9|nr:trypsin-like peptidase domain-containing protein [Lactococcus carnosus]MCJ1970454.1 trypsin-like serine protease [Lactococcus carnosus]